MFGHNNLLSLTINNLNHNPTHWIISLPGRCSDEDEEQHWRDAEAAESGGDGATPRPLQPSR